jgi:hypothetical protein
MMMMEEPMARPDETATVTPTADDVLAYRNVCDQVARIGAEAMASAALRAGSAIRSLAMFMAASGVTIDEVISMLRLEPGDVANALRVPAVKLAPGETATTFPDDDDLVPVATTGYAARRGLALADLPRTAQLAALVPGQRGVILFMAARGDFIDEVGALLGLTPDAVDTILESGDGLRLPRP